MPTTTRHVWLLNPAADLLVFSNIYWPILGLAAYVFSRGDNFAFFFILLGMTHRWLTVPLVALDWRQVRPRRVEAFLGSLGVIALFCALGSSARGFNALAIAVVVFDCWHRSSQHYGMLRMYARLAGQPDRDRVVFNAMRLLSFYAFLRSLAFIPLYDIGPTMLRYTPGWIRVMDYLALAGAIGLVTTLVAQPTRTPKTYYMISMGILYGFLLLAVCLHRQSWVSSLFLTAATFHAVEYLAITSRRVRQARNDMTGIRQGIVARWYWLLAIFVGGLVLLGWNMPFRFKNVWVGANLLASLLHYQLDGVIWKRPKSAALA